MRLTDLHPEFLGNGGDGVSDGRMVPVPFLAGVGVEFDCPCGCEHRCYVGFLNPIGGPREMDAPRWQREGDTFETLTLSPSIFRNPDKGGCGWHGYVRNGEIVNA